MTAEKEDLSSYLIPTTMCDVNHPLVQETAKRVTAGAPSEKEKAIKIFYYVRDTVEFSVAFSKSKSSQILKSRFGECITKTNVQVALLRAVGIPARMRWVMAQTKVLTGLVAPFMLRTMPEDASHFWTQCFLGDKWISCEGLLDKPLYEGMLKRGLLSKELIPTIDWDGEKNLELLTPWITADRGFVTSAEDAVEGYQNNGEGAPPVWLERLMAPIFLPYNKRFSDKIRRLTVPEAN